MKTAKKSNKVYTRIRRDILRRRYQPDELLPKETDFARELGVSRDTLRHALAMLEAESLVRRVRGYGTYVCASVPRQKITFLLPCPEQIFSSEYVMGLLRGVLSGAAEQNCE
ncbi:MAG: GntR family transcriptional regulator, partial [Lentisphaeria bacterium]|nr:GntR family transcriptional regulator [Lentisphaeria bacterium]